MRNRKAHQRIAELRENGFEVYVKRTRPVIDGETREPVIAWQGDNLNGVFEPEQMVNYFTRRELAAIRQQVPAARFAPTGGCTAVSLRDPGTGESWEGLSRCHPQDNFVKETGLQKALGRAFGAMLRATARTMEVA